MPAVVTPCPGKAVRKDAAFQIFAKGLAHKGLWRVVVFLAVKLARAGPRWPAQVRSSQISKCSAMVWYSSVRSGWRGL